MEGGIIGPSQPVREVGWEYHKPLQQHKKAIEPQEGESSDNKQEGES